MNKIYVSFTTYKDRLITGCVDKMVKSLLRQDYKIDKIIMTLFTDDLLYLTNYLKELLNENKIELLVTDIDIKSHKKYFYVMKKYKNAIIITVDDDNIYTSDLVSSLVNKYFEFPSCIIARRTHLITFKNGKLLPYKKWKRPYTEIETPSFDLFPTGGGGILYPPDCLKISDKNLTDIFKCLTCDDVYLKHLSYKLGIKIVYVKNIYPQGFPINEDDVMKSSLWKINLSKNENDKYIKIFPII